MVPEGEQGEQLVERAFTPEATSRVFENRPNTEGIIDLGKLIHGEQGTDDRGPHPMGREAQTIGSQPRPMGSEA